MSKFHLSNTMENFTEVSVNDHLDGAKINEILLSHKNYIIFKCDEGLRYFSAHVSNFALSKLSQLDLLQNKAFQKFKNINSHIIDSHITSALSQILGSEGTDEEEKINIDNALKNFEDFIQDEPAPNLIIASNKDYSIYLDSKNFVQYIIRDKTLQKSNILDELHRLRAWGTAVLPESKTRLLNLKLGTCLAIGFRAKLANEETDTNRTFSSATSYIEKNITDTATYYLILYVVIFSLTAMTSSALIYYSFSSELSEITRTLLIGSLGGVCGALISVLQRSKKLKVDMYESTKMIVLQGLVRVGLGCAFGMISLVACKAGLLLNIMSESNSRLLILAIAAGFSERLIPDFIEKTTTEKSEKTNK